MTHEKKSRNYEKRKENIGTKLTHLWNQHKMGYENPFCGFGQHYLGNGVYRDISWLVFITSHTPVYSLYVSGVYGDCPVSFHSLVFNPLKVELWQRNFC